MIPLLEVSGLKTYFEVPGSLVRAVEDIRFSIRQGEAVGIVGESGSGKSVLALSLMRLVPSPGRIVGGEAMFRVTE